MTEYTVREVKGHAIYSLCGGVAIGSSFSAPVDEISIHFATRIFIPPRPNSTVPPD
jgi:hypothetical protein